MEGDEGHRKASDVRVEYSGNAVLTDVTGPSDTLVLEITVAVILATFQSNSPRVFSGQGVAGAIREKMASLVDSGYREFFSVVESSFRPRSHLRWEGRDSPQ